jgi:hypothetical protein
LSGEERDALVEDVRAGPPTLWSAGKHEDYLESRPSESSPFNPAAEYGDPDWREPAFDAEAAARTAWLEENTEAAPGWQPRPQTAVENALEDAQERAILSDRAHDHDPYAWAEYQRLQALTELAPLPERDALDDLPRDERGDPDTLAAPDGHHEDRVARDHLADDTALDDQRSDTDQGPFTDTQGRWWPSTTAWVVGTCDPAKANHTEHLGHPDDSERLRRRIEDLRTTLAAGEASSPDDGEHWREQLARWHDDDGPLRAETDAGHDGADGDVDGGIGDGGGVGDGGASGGGAGEAGWSR